ncbi:hypothetical protein BEWA_022940 [Theileria equi strain WA]|uniref:Uncharacterized protein n=1 Tax=Theileria equi strain WA TaxID=1537102 RepID=L0AWQ7_THEEQ|nr:hypothetical protein BEWA_022940 [Theileria equi strain WA]AFZ79446.1 hypothetical protein BEWA_022940 [Theileria equi strain WA]|eukprot:XP_004829112.1 hypothetical protein BEWA_022940 [Theileria equi strain WA]
MDKGVTIDISMDPTSSNYGFSDYSTTYHDALNAIDLTECKDSTQWPGYRKFVHEPRDKRKIIGVRKKRVQQYGFEQSLANCYTATVYFWTGDSSYANPLLVQLGGESTYYSWKSDDSWGPDSDASGQFITRLDKQNCRRNKAHVANISKAESNTYDCYACKDREQKITFSTSSEEADREYKKVVHRITSGESGHKIGRIDNSYPPQHGIKIKGTITSLNVFYYPKTDDRALIIHFDGAWFTKTKSADEWEKKRGSTPQGTDDFSGILELIKVTNGASEGLTPGAIAGGVLGAGLGGAAIGLGLWKGRSFLKKRFIF